MSTLVRLSAFLVSVLLALPAAAAQRTFVASTGLDTNLCSITAPCRTFTAALAVTDPNGEVIVLDSAGYGAFTISQSVSIIAPEGVYAGISIFSGQHGIVVNGPGIKVALRGLTINGQGGDDGIRILSAGDVFLERVTVANTGNNNLDAGIRVATGATGARVSISDSSVRGTAGQGVWIEANATVRLDRGRIEGNGGIGIRGQAPGGRLTVSDSLVSENQGDGIWVNATTPGDWGVTVARSTVEGNALDGVVVGRGITGTYQVAIADSVVLGNGGDGFVLHAFPGEIGRALVGDNRIVGNSAAGIRCSSSGMIVVAERNEVVGNGWAFDQALGCTLESLGNNAARRNDNADFGAITTVPLR